MYVRKKKGDIHLPGHTHFMSWLVEGMQDSHDPCYVRMEYGEGMPGSSLRVWFRVGEVTGGGKKAV